MSDLKIEAGKFYKTRDGRKARIYAVDGADKYPIHGAVFEHSEWFQCMWRSGGSAGDGTFFNTPKQYSFDLISPWIDPPVVAWDRLPKHIVAVAMDEGGGWHGFSDVPMVYRNKFWFSPISKCHDLYRTFLFYDDDIPTFTGDWRDSLAVRPG